MTVTTLPGQVDRLNDIKNGENNIIFVIFFILALNLRSYFYVKFIMWTAIDSCMAIFQSIQLVEFLLFKIKAEDSFDPESICLLWFYLCYSHGISTLCHQFIKRNQKQWVDTPMTIKKTLLVFYYHLRNMDTYFLFSFVQSVHESYCWHQIVSLGLF